MQTFSHAGKMMGAAHERASDSPDIVHQPVDAVGDLFRSALEIGPVAQLDRVPVSETGGRRFEPCRDRQ